MMCNVFFKIHVCSCISNRNVKLKTGGGSHARLGVPHESITPHAEMESLRRRAAKACETLQARHLCERGGAELKVLVLSSVPPIGRLIKTFGEAC